MTKYSLFLLALATACLMAACMITACGRLCPNATYTPIGTAAKCNYADGNHLYGCDDGREYYTDNYSLNGSCP